MGGGAGGEEQRTLSPRREFSGSPTTLGALRGTELGAPDALSPFTCASYSACSPRSRRSFPCAAMASGRPRRRAPLLPRGRERAGRRDLGLCSQHPPNGSAPPRPQRGSRGGAPPAWNCPPRLFRRGPTAAGSCRPLALGAGHTPESLVPHAQRPSSQGPRVRASTCPANWHPLAATPTPRRWSGHPSQTTPFTAWPWVLNASRE